MEIYFHRLSQKQAKEGPRLLESLAGAETVVFRVQGAARRVGLFREVVVGGEHKTKRPVHYYPAPLCPLNLWKAGFKDPQREQEKGLGDLGMGFSGLNACLCCLSSAWLLLWVLNQSQEVPGFLHIHTWGRQELVCKRGRPIGE